MPAATEQAVIAACDLTLLGEVMEACLTSLRRYRELACRVAPDQVQGLYAVIADMIASGDLAFVIPVVRACATALRHYPGPAALPADMAAELYAALNEFGPAAVALYPQERGDGEAR
jgi:hypothetical protein